MYLVGELRDVTRIGTGIVVTVIGTDPGTGTAGTEIDPVTEPETDVTDLEIGHDTDRGLGIAVIGREIGFATGTGTELVSVTETQNDEEAVLAVVLLAAVERSGGKGVGIAETGIAGETRQFILFPR